MGITLEQKLDCLLADEYNAIEELVDIILKNRRSRKAGYVQQTTTEFGGPT